VSHTIKGYIHSGSMNWVTTTGIELGLVKSCAIKTALSANSKMKSINTSIFIVLLILKFSVLS
jgi:hypothetical protein